MGEAKGYKSLSKLIFVNMFKCVGMWNHLGIVFSDPL